ncbi:MAG: hypothetical protein KDI92_14120 [Xanthomonadales bacterium]|nr:hypothetical protein [Xanthomonadales bacterium]
MESVKNRGITGALSALLHLTEHQVLIKEIESQKIIKLEISKEEFNGLKVNHMYSEEWKKGALNLIYKNQ